MTEPRTREEYADAAIRLSDVPGVIDTTVISNPNLTTQLTGEYDHVLEPVVGPEYERVPPRVLRLLAECDCGIRDVTTRGEPRHHVVEAV